MGMKRSVWVWLAMFIGMGMFLTGCTQCNTKPSCSVASTAVSAVVGQVAPVLGCSNQAAMTTDFTAELAKLNVCTPQAVQGGIANLVCPAMAKYVIGLGVQALPPAWGCTGGSAASVTGTALIAACQKVPF